MKRFHFSLERILAIRKFHEREWEIKLAEAAGRCQRHRKTISAAEDEIRRVQHRAFASKRLSSGDLEIKERYLIRKREEIHRARMKLEKAEEEWKETHAQYLDASRERKVLDNLSEKRRNQYYREQRKEEIKLVDDITNSAYAAGQSEERRGL